MGRFVCCASGEPIEPLLQLEATLLHKVFAVLGHKRLVGQRRNHKARVLVGQALVQPVKVLEAALHGLLLNAC